MSVAEKIRKFSADKGIRLNWMAKQLGTESIRFTQYLCEYREWPEKYWKKMIELTYGELNLADFVDHAFNKKGFFRVEWDEKEQCAKIYFK